MMSLLSNTAVRQVYQRLWYPTWTRRQTPFMEVFDAARVDLNRAPLHSSFSWYFVLHNSPRIEKLLASNIETSEWNHPESRNQQLAVGSAVDSLSYIWFLLAIITIITKSKIIITMIWYYLLIWYYGVASNGTGTTYYIHLSIFIFKSIFHHNF